MQKNFFFFSLKEISFEKIEKFEKQIFSLKD
jgi:hypothetical protein